MTRLHTQYCPESYLGEFPNDFYSDESHSVRIEKVPGQRWRWSGKHIQMTVRAQSSGRHDRWSLIKRGRGYVFGGKSFDLHIPTEKLDLFRYKVKIQRVILGIALPFGETITWNPYDLDWDRF